MKKKLIIIISIVCTLAIALGVTFIIMNTPKNVAKRAFGDVLTDLMARDEIEYAMDVLDEGSVAADLNIGLNERVLDASGKLHLGMEEHAVLFNDVAVSLKSPNKQSDISGSVYADDKQIYVENTEILGGTYGIKRENLSSTFENSVLNPASGTKFALNEELYNLIKDALKLLESDLPENVATEASKIAKDHFYEIYDLFFDHVEYQKKTDNISIGGVNTDARVITMIVTPQTIINIIDDYCNYINSDEELRNFVIKYFEELKPAIKLFYAYVFGAELDEDINIAEEYDEFIEELTEEFDKLAEEFEKEDEDYFMAINIATPKLSATIMKLWIVQGDDVADIDDPDETEEVLSVDFGTDGLEDSKRISISSYGDEIKYTVTESGDEISYKLNIDDDIIISLSLNEEKESYTLKLTDKHGYYDYYNNYDEPQWIEWEDVITVKGSYTVSGDASTFTVKTVEEDGKDLLSDFDDFDISITVNTSDSMPDVKDSVSSVADLKEDDIEAIFDRAADVIK